MSSHNDNTNNKKLRELLDKKSKPTDDFEREALEGFAMLDSDEEIVDLKQNLDKKIYAEVFTAEKKSSKSVYWFAAAGLFLVIGFSVYLVRNSPVKESDLAISNSQKPAGEALQNVIEAESKKDESAEFKAAEPAVSRSEKISQQPEAQKTRSAKGTAEDEFPVEKNSVGIAASGAAMGESKPQPNSAAPAEPAKYATSDDISVKETAARDQELDKAPVEEKMTDALAKTSVQNKQADIKEKKAKRAERMKSDEDVNFQAPAAPAAEATMGSAGPEERTAYYTGGEEALNKELKNKLEAKGIIGKFDATVSINEKKKVEKVQFTNAYKLTEEQQKEVIVILKALDKFDFKGKPSNMGLIEHRISYRP